MFAVADARSVDAMKDRARALIAADILAADQTRLAQFSDEVRKKIEAYQKNARSKHASPSPAATSTSTTQSRTRRTGICATANSPPQEQGDTKTATIAVLTLLRDEGKIRTEPFTASYLRVQDLARHRAVHDHRRTSPTGSGSTTRPRSSGTLSLIREAIIAGIKNDGWVYYDAATGKAYTAQHHGRSVASSSGRTRRS